MRLRYVIGFFVSIGICLAAGAIGAFFTAGALSVWYAELVKPPFTPPDWLFAPVWMVLYIMMGISVFLIWCEGFENDEVKWGIGLFAIQLVLNVLWSFVFFGLNSIIGGLVVIIALWFAILFTMLHFFRVTAFAGWLLIPYFVWVSFATILNYSFLVLNG